MNRAGKTGKFTAEMVLFLIRIVFSSFQIKNGMYLKLFYFMIAQKWHVCDPPTTDMLVSADNEN
jgi:hypothetical protein